MQQNFLRNSTSFESDLSTQQRPPIPLPAAPALDATPQEVRLFFKQCFLSQRTELSESKAEEEAAELLVKVRMTGECLYRLSRESLVATFGLEGEIIYDLVQSGREGYVSL